MKTKTTNTIITWITAGILAILLSNPTFAEGITKEEYCEGQGRLGRTIMSSRQTGVPMLEMLEMAKDSDLFKSYIRMAFTRPKFNTDEYRDNAADQFANEIYLLCMKNSK